MNQVNRKGQGCEVLNALNILTSFQSSAFVRVSDELEMTEELNRLSDYMTHVL